MTRPTWTTAALMACLPLPTAAGCGSAFCSLNTDWRASAVWTEPGSRIGLRYEFIDQDQPRNGARDVGVGELPAHHDEVRTINRNWIASYDFAFDPQWSAGLQLPLVDRSHLHIHNHHGAQLPEAWNFTEIGDTRVVGRYRSSPDPAALGLQFGLKLPTGEYKVANADGDVAERSLQPGTGTVDAIAGVFKAGLWGSTTWFSDITWTRALAKREDYRPGDRIGINAGIARPAGGPVTLLLQLNALWKERDAGSAAEPEDSGGTFVHLSPGVAVNVTGTLQAYGFVQLPVYQYVNGVQLVADWAAVAGLSQRF